MALDPAVFPFLYDAPLIVIPSQEATPEAAQEQADYSQKVEEVQQEVAQAAEPEPTAPAPPQKVWMTEKEYLVVVPLLEGPAENLLLKILESIGLSEEKTGRISPNSFSWDMLHENTQRIIVFGKYPLPQLKQEPFTKANHRHAEVLQAVPLQALSQNVAFKKQLWQALKEWK